MTNDAYFPKNAQLSLLIERNMCFGDAAVMVGEGRYYAARYINQLGEENPEAAKECKKCTEYFMAASNCVHNFKDVICNKY